MINNEKFYSKYLKEKFIKEGFDEFNESEVVELMLSIASPTINIKRSAENLFNKFGSFDSIVDAPLIEILKVPGIKSNAALLLKSPKNFSSYYSKNKKN